MPSPGIRSSDHSGRHGPNPPMRMLGSIFQRQPSTSLRAPTVTRYRSQLTGRRGFIRPRRSASSSSVPGLRVASAARRRWSSHGSEVARQESGPLGVGHVRRVRLEGSPSRFTRWLTRWGQASASWSMSPPPLEWPTTGTASCDTLSSTTSASRTSASQLCRAACSESPWLRWSHDTTR
jgi:hypothetical protein